MTPPSLSVVVPAYDEAERLPPMLRAVLDCVRATVRAARPRDGGESSRHRGPRDNAASFGAIRNSASPAGTPGAAFVARIDPQRR